MKKLYLKETEETPQIIFDKDKPEFRISGKSYMEDAAAFYEPILSWLRDYIKSPAANTKFVFELEYVNTASSKVVNDLLDLLEDLYLDGKKVNVEWNYFEEDEDMKEMGEEYEEIYELPFIIKQIDHERPDNLFVID
jgi:hypothetical protein